MGVSASRKKGFTIVELLIVIVVIAVLAAISIVAYNGIQQRTKNARVVAGVNAYLKAVENYKTVNSVYPTFDGCLGADYPGNVCWQGDSGFFTTNGTLDASLSEFMPTRPVLATELFSIGVTNNMRAGLMYDYQNATNSRMVFYIEGLNQSCGVSGFNGGNEGGKVTQCIKILTN